MHALPISPRARHAGRLGRPGAGRRLRARYAGTWPGPLARKSVPPQRPEEQIAVLATFRPGLYVAPFRQVEILVATRASQTSEVANVHDAEDPGAPTDRGSDGSGSDAGPDPVGNGAD